MGTICEEKQCIYRNNKSYNHCGTCAGLYDKPLKANKEPVSGVPCSAGVIKPCPTQAGSFTGYEVQVNKPHRGWQPFYFDKVCGGKGVLLPSAGRGILDTLGLLGYAQAKSLAWMIKASAASDNKDVEVRIMPYDVQYDTKAYKRETDIEAL